MLTSGPLRRLDPRWLTLVSIVVPLVVLGVLSWRHRWSSDDAFINFRIAEQVLAGNGPVFNAGERAEAATSTLWLAMLVLGSFLPGPMEWFAALAGIVLTVAGLGLASAAAARRIGPGAGALLPAGALVVAVLPPFWDYASSGLETGLGFGWLGLTMWLLARQPLRVGPAAVVAGLGPLVRPDFAIYSLFFLVALLVIARPDIWRAARVLAIALAAPVAYEIFRMGYFGAIVPNTAFAKEASLARWDQGWIYLGDLVGPYVLWLPLALLGALALGPALVAAARRHDRRDLALLLAPLLAGLIHAVYVIRVGGDFMHARLLLPTVFALIIPVAVVRITPARAIAFAGTSVWAVVALTSLRVDYGTAVNPKETIGTQGIADERGFYLGPTRQPLITLDDYAEHPFTQDGHRYREIASTKTDEVLIYHMTANPVGDVRVDGVEGGPMVTVAAGNVGLLGFAAGTDVHLLDIAGLADPIAGRLELGERGRPGHEKRLPQAWSLARHAEPGADPEPALAEAPTDDEIAAARRALACADLDAVTTATSGPLTPGRFAANVVDSLHLHSVRIPVDPFEAQEELCRR